MKYFKIHNMIANSNSQNQNLNKYIHLMDEWKEGGLNHQVQR